MNRNNGGFYDYLAGLDTKTFSSSKKEIARTYRAVMKKAGLKRKAQGTKRIGRVCLIAAAAVVCTAATAAAAGFNVGELFRGYFEHGARAAAGASGSTASLTQSQILVLGKSGKPVDQSVTDNGTTVAVKAVTGDQNDAYILLDVTAPQGTKLDRNDYSFYRGDSVTEMDLLEKGGAGITGYGWSGGWDYTTLQDAAPEDNRVQIVLSLNFSGIDLRGKEVRLSFKNITVPDKNRKTEYLPVIQGEWNLEVPLDYTSPSKELTVNRLTHFKPYADPKTPAGDREENSETTLPCTVKTIRLSSLSAVVVYGSDKTAAEGHANPTPSTLTIHFKDGTQAAMQGIGPGMAGDTESTRSYLFNAPVDIDSISSVTVGDLTVPVS